MLQKVGVKVTPLEVAPTQYCIRYSHTHSLTHLLTYLLIYLLTYSMVQSPSWEANWFAASQEIPRISRNPKVHYRNHKWPPPVPILNQINLVHTPTLHFLKICLNIILPSKPGSPKWSIYLRFPTKTLYTPLLSPCTLHAPPISFFSILSHEQYWLRSTEHSAPRYALIRNDSMMDVRLIAVGLGLATITNELFDVASTTGKGEAISMLTYCEWNAVCKPVTTNMSTARTLQVISGSCNIHRLPHFLDED